MKKLSKHIWLLDCWYHFLFGDKTTELTLFKISCSVMNFKKRNSISFKRTHKLTMMAPFTMLILQLCVWLCSSDRLLNRANVDQQKYHDAPKNWFKYLKALLCHLLTQSTRVTQYIRSCKHLAKTFVVHTNQLQSNFKIIDLVCQVHKFTHCVGQEAVSECLGQIKTSTEHIQPHTVNSMQHIATTNIYVALASRSLKTFFNKDHLYYSLQYVWQFHLDSTLSLNISFQHIDMLFKPMYCQFDNIQISPLDMKHKFIVCHKQSAFNLYPPGNRISVTQTHFLVHVLFAVVDFCVVTTHFLPLALQAQDAGTFQIKSIKQKPINHQVFTFLMQVSKKLGLVLCTEQCEEGTYFAYDGPGVLSPRVLLSHGQYTMSSFQCVYQQVLAMSKKTTKCNVTYSSRQLPAQWKLPVTTTTNMSHFSLRHMCNNSPCFGLVNTTQQITLNLTILHLVLKSSETLSCQYGALHIEGIPDKYQVNTICKNHSALFSPSNSFYLKRLSIPIVLYWYKFYTEIEVILSLSTTHCNVTVYDVCTDPRLSQMAGVLQNLVPSWQSIQRDLQSVIQNQTEAESFPIQYQVLFESSCTIWQIRHNA